ncbi:zf-HC2 domain-containing protein [Ureibacillus chungkukjangi]|uniref:Putative zinc finger protein n=1 Tax=Ureibacillus chungkukjangi TaxID=1202712 RepID=A0A318TUM9_9BACL|nr:zf-HC2 domain-containing protein [Ureibacillus chungkukjangi]PYF08374.1 putative zinc finger protein [Ureibacillus chungkukjangi]
MKEIKCTIIQDILPLYIDGVVSQDTTEMVDKHLQDCENCRKEYESMKQELYIPVENKESLLKAIKKKWRNKKFMIAMGSILGTAIILFGAFNYVFYYKTVIPYSENLIKIETQNDQLVSHYLGKSHAGVYGTHPISVVVDGEKKNVSFIYYTKTIAHSPTRNLLDENNGQDEYDYIFGLPESEKIDAVYYVEFDANEVFLEKDSWESVIERGQLIWKRE